jgi:diaminopimelate epimerase
VVTGEIDVVKLNGTGNAFLLLDERRPHALDYPDLARRWCDRERGYGADGLLVVSTAHHRAAAAHMRMFNPDGSEAEMCGNGVRCVVRYLVEHDPELGDHLGVQTASGVVDARVLSRVPEFCVRLTFERPRISTVDGELELVGFRPPRVRYTAVSVGNPHAVVFVDNLAAVPLYALGAQIETDPAFPGGTNAHFVEIAGPHELRVLHWERGAGATLACGSGAVACAVAAIAGGVCESPVDQRVPGGLLTVTWEGDDATLAGSVEREWQHSVPLP